MKIIDKYEKIRQLEIKSRLLADTVLAGMYRTAFKGSGQDYRESRPYEQGDDIRRIDSRMSALSNQLFVKTFDEERQINLIIVADVSSSVAIDNFDNTKLQSLAEIAALIAGCAFLNNDKVGLLLFSEVVEKFIPPSRREDTISEVLSPLFSVDFSNKTTNIAKALKYLCSTFREKAVVFLISDFFDANYLNELRIASKQFDLILIQLVDEIIENPIDEGIVLVDDIESGERAIVDFYSDSILATDGFVSQAGQIARKNGIDIVKIAVGENFFPKFVEFMKNRAG